MKLLCTVCMSLVLAEPVAGFTPIAIPQHHARRSAPGVSGLTFWNDDHDALSSSFPATQLFMSDAPLSDFATIQQPLAITSNNQEAAKANSKNLNGAINVASLLALVAGLGAYIVSLNAGISHGWTHQEYMTRLPIDVWHLYSHALAVHPVVVKAVTSATVYAIGDVLAQLSTSNGATVADLDRARTLRSTLAGLIGHGPMSHCWYLMCDGIFENVLQWTEWWAFFPKVIVDQTVWGPIWNGSYILLLGAMQMERPGKLWEDVKSSTVPLFLSGLKLWPLAHVVTYGLIPVEHRLLWVDMVEILWVSILATQASSLVATDSVSSAGAEQSTINDILEERIAGEGVTMKT